MHRVVSSSESLQRTTSRYSGAMSEPPHHAVEEMVDERVRSSLAAHKAEMLQDIEKLLCKISGRDNDAQLCKISDMLSSGEKFKRKSNEEQFRYNSKVKITLDDADTLLQSDKVAECRQKIAEGNSRVKFY